METPGAASYLRPRARQRWICRSPRGSFFVLFLLSFAVRIALLPFAPLDPVWQTRWEVGAVAHNLATTGEYGNPYLVPTGPSAHTTPFYTGLMALIFWLFGVTMAAEYVRCLLIIISYSAMYAALPWLAERLGAGVRAGLVGGAIGALSPLHVPLSVDSGWDEQYAAMALGLLMVASLARWTSNHRSATGSLLLGFGWGAAFHASPPLLLVMLGCVAFELCWLRARRNTCAGHEPKPLIGSGTIPPSSCG